MQRVAKSPVNACHGIKCAAAGGSGGLVVDRDMQQNDSLGLALLRAIIESGRAPSFATCGQISSCIGRVQPTSSLLASTGVPTLQIMQENGFPLPPAGGPPAYALDRVVNRRIVNIVGSHFPKLQRALARRDGKQLHHLVAEIASAINRFSNAQDVSNSRIRPDWQCRRLPPCVPAVVLCRA